jgi:phosphohistidine phosphatase SixA
MGRMAKYILLMRHGKVQRTAGTPDEKQPLAQDGKEVREVAVAAADHLGNLPPDNSIKIGKFWAGRYCHTQETAAILHQKLEAKGLICCEIEPMDILDPDKFLKNSNRQQAGDAVLDTLTNLMNVGENGNAILVVGHGPQMGWIAEKIFEKPTPISRGELLCIEMRDKKPRLLWAISPTDQKTLTELREKIKSKQKLAELVGGLVVAILSFLLGLILGDDTFTSLGSIQKIYLYGAFSTIFIALLLYGATMFAYDELSMPTRFWPDSMNNSQDSWVVHRPPSPAVWVLYQNMVRIWKYMFLPACGLVFLGLFLIAQAVLAMHWFFTVSLLFLIPLAYNRYYRHFKPSLGVTD